MTNVIRGPDGRIEIQLAGGTLVTDLDLLEEALSMPEARVYRRNGAIVQLIDTKVTVRDGEIVEDKGIAELKGRGLIEPIMRVACPLKWNATAKKLVPINCPLDVADSYLARGSWPKLPPLTGITNAPTLRPDGSLLDQPGYDKVTGLLFLPQPGVKFPGIADAPKWTDAAFDALAALDELIGKFPFVSEVDRSVAVAALLTGVVRRMLPTAPAFGFSAPTPGTGKGLLVNTVAMVAMGRKKSLVDKFTTSLNNNDSSAPVSLNKYY